MHNKVAGLTCMDIKEFKKGFASNPDYKKIFATAIKLTRIKTIRH